MSVSSANIEEATFAEVQKYMEDHGVIELRIWWEGVHKVWFYRAVLRGGAAVSGGGHTSMAGAMKALVHALEEA